MADGSAVTWGDADYGGDSVAVQQELKEVQDIQATLAAFAAILSNGSVATWQKPSYQVPISIEEEYFKDQMNHKIAAI